MKWKGTVKLTRIWFVHLKFGMDRVICCVDLGELVVGTAGAVSALLLA